jgi:mannose/fructose/N-acetylgalactosamine-specific phosphotransferase system component IIC
VLIAYFGSMITMLGVAVIAAIIAFVYYTMNDKKAGAL